MTRLLFLFYLLLSSLISKAQENLILNPSCEEATEIPNNIAAYENCINWWKPYIFTTDYFSSLTASANVNFIPNNGFGYQSNIDGNFYIGGGLIQWDYSTSEYANYRLDYAAGRLSKILRLFTKVCHLIFFLGLIIKGLN